MSLLPPGRGDAGRRQALRRHFCPPVTAPKPELEPEPEPEPEKETEKEEEVHDDRVMEGRMFVYTTDPCPLQAFESGPTHTGNVLVVMGGLTGASCSARPYLLRSLFCHLNSLFAHAFVFLCLVSRLKLLTTQMGSCQRATFHTWRHPPQLLAGERSTHTCAIRTASGQSATINHLTIRPRIRWLCGVLLTSMLASMLTGVL